MKTIVVYLVIFLTAITAVMLGVLWKPLPPWLNDYKLLIFCALVGGVGGCVYCLRAIYLNKCVRKQWDENWHTWYYIRPIVSVVCGAVSYLFLRAGLIVLESSQVASSTNLGFLALAFIAGLNVDKFLAKLEDIAGASWGIEKTGYKIFNRYKDCGLDGLTDRSRRPYRQANRLPVQVETLIVRLRRLHPDVHTPAISTVHAVLDRHGLVKRRRKRRYKAQGTTLSKPRRPNALWCADYKGEFMLADRRYCYPLTISDFASRYLITCDALSTTKEIYAFTVFTGLSASCSMIWASSTMRWGASKTSRTLSRRGCYPCLRYEPLPMCPERNQLEMVAHQDSNVGPSDNEGNQRGRRFELF